MEEKEIKKDDVDKQLKKVSFTKSVFKYYKREWKLASSIVLFVILSVLTTIMLPLLTTQISEDIMLRVYEANSSMGQMKYNDFWGLDWYVSLSIGIGVTLLNVGFMYLNNYFGVLMSKRIEIDLRNKALEKLVKQDISYYSDKKIGEILTKIISDTQIMGDQAYQIPNTMIRVVFTVFGSFIMMLIFDWRISLVIFGGLILVLLVIVSSFGWLKKGSLEVRNTVTQINGNATDRINNVRLIKATGTEDFETERFKEIHKEYYTKSKKLGKMQAYMVAALFGGVTMLQLLTIAISAIFYHGTGMEVMSFYTTKYASITLAESLLTGAIMQTMMLSVNIANATVATGRIYDLINAKSRMDPHYDNSGIKINEINGDIVFKDVEFRYPEKPEKEVLPKFDFTFKKGKSYAFVGETGSGKSTIAKLLLRFYDPTNGQILINGQDNLKDVKLSTYLDHVGYVEQEPQILFGNVLENIKYGKFDATDEEVIEAAKKAELHDLIMTWPEGYETILGERGFMLSGGQKQRLVIARMFLKDPQILILDEATSALDNIVEKEIQSKLDDLMDGRTTVSIAHRLSTVKNVDEVVVLGANGKGIVQQGTFEELKEQDGHFKNLYEAGLME